MASLPPLAPERARSIIDSIPHTRVLVVGDVMLDQFTIGRVSRISPEAPVPVAHPARSPRVPTHRHTNRPHPSQAAMPIGWSSLSTPQ